MKQFYVCEPRYDFIKSHIKYELVEYDINTLIRDEAEAILSCDYNIADLPDDAFFKLVDKKANEITKELMCSGIYRNKFGHPMFLYC